MKVEHEDGEELTIIHFNDVYDIEPDSYNQYGFVNFYDTYLSLKKEYPDSIVAFSGDAFAPSKLSKVKKGRQMVHCLKKMKIDIACYGNHEFDFPL
jgi:5'-nucleotidase